MKGTDRLNIQGRRLLEDRLHLCAELAHDPDVVAAGFTGPVLLHVQRAELSKGVRGKKHLLRALIAHQHLRPMNHGRPDKSQGMLSQLQRAAFLDHHLLRGKIGLVVILHHVEGGQRRDDLRIRILRCKAPDIRGMVRLHVMDHEIVRLAAI